jgi:hypothetical protein
VKVDDRHGELAGRAQRVVVGLGGADGLRRGALRCAAVIDEAAGLLVQAVVVPRVADRLGRRVVSVSAAGPRSRRERKIPL